MSEGSELDWLAVVRARREHLRALYFQLESRAQVVLGLTVAVAGALLPSVAKHASGAGDAEPWFWTAAIASVLTAMVTTLPAVLVLAPPVGRHLFPRGSRLERSVTRLGEWCGRTPPCPGPKRPDDLALSAWLASILRLKALPSELTLGVPLVRCEVENLWAVTFVVERRAGLLRLSLLGLPPFLVAALGLYITTVEPDAPPCNCAGVMTSAAASHPPSFAAAAPSTPSMAVTPSAPPAATSAPPASSALKSAAITVEPPAPDAGNGAAAEQSSGARGSSAPLLQARPVP